MGVTALALPLDFRIILKHCSQVSRLKVGHTEVVVDEINPVSGFALSLRT
jgi:hypothetical protein